MSGFSSSSSRIISAKDHGGIQIDIVSVDPSTGRMIPGQATRYAICGELRRMGESDDAIVRLAKKVSDYFPPFHFILLQRIFLGWPYSELRRTTCVVDGLSRLLELVDY